MANSQAIFDCLFICEELSKRFRGATQGEVHLFSYLACLLAIFDGQPVADWGYGFAGLELGAPFSRDLSDSIDLLLARGSLQKSTELLATTNAASSELAVLVSLSLYERRVMFLRAACSTALTMPIGTIRNALQSEPGLRPVKTIKSNRELFQEAALSQLYEQFDSLNAALGRPATDLLVPATIWLTYLAHPTSPNTLTTTEGERPSNA